jgi:hypothetical protein
MAERDQQHAAQREAALSTQRQGHQAEMAQRAAAMKVRCGCTCACANVCMNMCVREKGRSTPFAALDI